MKLRLESERGVIRGTITETWNVPLRIFLFHAIHDSCEDSFEELAYLFPSRRHIPMLAGFVRQAVIDPASVVLGDDSITFCTASPSA